MIAEYADSLAAHLGFHRRLARRVRQEVEEHLRDAVAAAGGGAEAERRAIARFGDARAIAAQFARESLAQQARRTGMIVLAVLGAMLLAMQSRIFWYDFTEWAACARLEAASEVIALVDVIAFCGAALAAGRRFSLAAGAVLVSVACDAALTVFRLSGWDYSVDFLVPLGSMAIEVACAIALLAYIRIALRRTAAASALAR
jgi:hypothetical protein